MSDNSDNSDSRDSDSRDSDSRDSDSRDSDSHDSSDSSDRSDRSSSNDSGKSRDRRDRSDNLSTDLGMGLGSALRGGDSFVEELCVKLVEQHVRKEMLGLPTEPVTIGRWELWEPIDQGAMGAVFRGFDPKLRRQVAIKILLTPQGANHQELRERMATEARAMAHIGHHANAIQIHDFHEPTQGDRDDQVQSYLVMDYIDGTNLYDWQQSKQRTWQQIVEKYTQAAQGLAHIHTHKLVHRDIKPANILVREDGVVLIGDLGLVHRSDSPPAHSIEDKLDAKTELRDNAMPANPFSTRMTRDGALVGTLSYMAPEQLREGQTSPQSDQFSFFVSLYQALYGHFPYQARTQSALLEAMDQGPLKCTRGPLGEPAWLRGIIDRGLALLPEDRHADMGEVVAALQEGVQPQARGWGSTVAFGSLTLGLGVLFTLLILRGNDPCLETNTLPEWSLTKRAIAHFGFLTSGVQGADLSWTRFESVTDEFARSWRGMKIETCIAIEQQNAQADQDTHSTDEPTLATSRDQCLDDSADLLGAFMRRYRDASASDVYSSEFAAYELAEALRACSKDQFVSAWAKSDSRAHGPKLDLVREQLANALVLEIGGHLEQAATLASSALNSAQQLNAAGIEAQAALRLGRINSLLRRDDQALALLSDARKMALASSRDDIVADAMIELIKLLALGIEDFKRADAIAELVDSQIGRLGEGELRRLAAAAEARGLLSREKGATKAAINHHRRALQIRESTDNSPIGDRVRTLINLANALSDLEADEKAIFEARTHYKEALKLAPSLGPKHPLLVDAERTFGAFLMQLGEFEQARAHSESALALATEIYGDPSPQAAVLHLHLGSLFATTEDNAKATVHLNAALRYFEAHVQPGRINSDHISALQLLAELERLAGSSDEAADTLKRTIQLIRAADGHAPLEAYTRGVLGELLVDEGHYAAALPHLKAALQQIGKSGTAENDSTTPYLMSALALAQTHTGDRAGAHRSAQRASELAEHFHLSEAPEILNRLQSFPLNPNNPPLNKTTEKPQKATSP